MDEKFTITLQVTAEQGEKIFKLLAGSRSHQAKYQEAKRKRGTPTSTPTSKVSAVPSVGDKFISYYRDSDDGMIYFDEFKDAESAAKSKKHLYKPIGFLSAGDFMRMKKEFLFTYNNNIEALLSHYNQSPNN